MTRINSKAPIMVTGATGYVAGWLVKELLEAGHTVHAPVRNPNNTKKLEHLRTLSESSPGTIRFFKADLLQDGSYAEAMKGCELVFHTASPFTYDYSDPQKDLIDPAVNGTKNILRTASDVGSVKRVVVTSSCAAMYTDAIDIHHQPNKVLTDAVWNTTASLKYQPYSYSKTLAEKAAWEMVAKQDEWDLVVVNPSFVMGPALNPASSNSESINILKQMGDGTLKMGAPNVGVGVVDVRDLAVAHMRAGLTPEAEGRHIISAHNTSILKMAKALHKNFGSEYPIPNKAIPKWLLMLVGPMVNKALSRKYIRNNVDVEWKADNSKSKSALNMEYRPLENTMTDAFQSLIDADIIK